VSDDPDAYFADREFEMRCHQADGSWWADLYRRSSDFTVPLYGRGDSVDEAKVSALRRWIIEQEPPSN
jgi:hypothetical protein